MSKLLDHLKTVKNRSGAIRAVPSLIKDLKSKIDSVPLDVNVPGMSGVVDVVNVARGLATVVSELESLTAAGDFGNILGKLAGEFGTDLTKIPVDALALAMKSSFTPEEILRATGGVTFLGSALSGLDASALPSLPELDVARAVSPTPDQPDEDEFLRLDGSIAMEADLDLGGNDLVNVGSVSGNGASLTSVNAVALAGHGASYFANSTHTHSVVNSISSGFMTSIDKSKLDGIESGATADMTASEILTAIKTVDGPGSGLDADLLDGNESSYYANSTHVHSASDVTSGTLNDARLPSTMTGKTFSSNVVAQNVLCVGNSTVNAFVNSTSLFVGNSTVSMLMTGSGLKFPEPALISTDQNTLDDYEEGTFTPTTEGQTTVGTGTYGTNVGYYVKIGKLVWFSVVINQTAHTGTGEMRIAGLPFTVTGGLQSPVMASEFVSMAFTSGKIPSALASGTEITLREFASNTAAVNLSMDTSCTIRVAGCYITNN